MNCCYCDIITLIVFRCLVEAKTKERHVKYHTGNVIFSNRARHIRRGRLDSRSGWFSHIYYSSLYFIAQIPPPASPCNSRYAFC